MYRISLSLKCFVFIACCLLSVSACLAHDADHPLKMHAELNSSECDDALILATAIYQSDSSFFDTPQIDELEVPYAAINSDIIFGNITFNGSKTPQTSKFFTAYPQIHASHRNIFWGNTPMQGNRLVIQISEAGWRGDTFYLYLIAQDITPDDFLTTLANFESKELPQPLVFDGTWLEPLIFRHKISEKIWILDLNSTLDYDVSKPLSWNVYTPIGDKLEKICSIDFPQLNAKEYDDLQSLIKFSSLLMETYGDGSDEGTLQPTARIRRSAKRQLYNALFRPWSLQDPYNSKLEVDEGLKMWAQQDDLTKALYQKIQHQYALAQRSLERFYHKQYGLSLKEAQNFAAYALDIVYRKHFMFHSEQNQSNFLNKSSGLNPWPLKKDVME